MIRNYMLTAWRNLLRNRVFTLINVSGLAIGMGACMIIAQYVSFEKSYDRFHADQNNIYRMVNVRYFPTRVDESAGCIASLGPTLKEMFPEVQQFARCYKTDERS